MGDEVTDYADSVASEDLRYDQRLQSETLQDLDLMLGHAELNEFRRQMQLSQHRDKLVAHCQKLLQSIHEKESFLRYVYEALAKDRAELEAINQEIENLEQRGMEPRVLGSSFLARHFLEEQTSSDTSRPFSEDQTPSDTPRHSWDALDCGGRGLFDYPARESQDNRGVFSEGKNFFHNHMRLSRPSKVASAVKTMPELPKMVSCEGSSGTINDSALHSAISGIVRCAAAFDEIKKHPVRLWQRPPGAALTMPALPIMSFKLEENEFSLESGSSTEEHCSSIQQQQDDTNVFLQSGRIHIERLGGQDIEEQDQPVENVFKAEQLPLSKFTAPLSLSQQGDGKTAFNPLKNFKSSMLSLASRIPSAQGAFAGRGNMGVWLIVSMILCTVIAAIGVFVPAMYDNNDEKRTTHLRTNDMMRHSSMSRENTGLGAGTTATMSGRPFLPSPMQPQRFEPVVRRSENRVTSTFQPYGSQPAPLSPLRVNQPFMPPQSSLPSLASGLPSSGVKAPDDQLAMPMSKRMPPPLCPTLVLPVCEARFGVPMFEIAQLVTEGELGIVGLSGNPLLRASVRKVGRRRSLEVSMPEAGSAPRATIAPNIQDLNRPDDGILEIRGLKGSFYGMLEMRASGACYVTKDGETMMIIDGDTDSLQLSIKSGGGMPLASVRCSTEPFGGIDHVEIRVEPGVDTVLVLACVLAVLLLSPNA